ncbi:hypothetical protein PAL_GLEAN10006814 [Pteropus alecto]|uniref:Uncharacterized protein n=1 Tax=Pteropus alecto TaxID=9402 RepID=L5L634_PTEAL|nr:hypothetical protein PAL_GLEAN10006814 [Pteropus alecto]
MRPRSSAYPARAPASQREGGDLTVSHDGEEAGGSEHRRCPRGAGKADAGQGPRTTGQQGAYGTPVGLQHRTWGLSGQEQLLGEPLTRHCPPPLASSWISSSQVANHNHVTNASCSDDELTEKTQHSNKAHPLAEAATRGVRRKLCKITIRHAVVGG